MEIKSSQVNIILSICVISHNQRDALKRCMDSIIAQNIPFEYEVIISDDVSTDGSHELARTYAKKYPHVHVYSCNTDDYNPSNKSSRSGWNRCNALKYARGKYIAHIDGDDFLQADSHIYEKQVALLEQHPECSCCMANDYSMEDGNEISTIKLRHTDIFTTGYVLKNEEYIRNYFRESHCYVYRRNPDVSPIELLGGYYVDNCITAFYLQYGDIICLQDAGYVYVQYKTSVWHDYEKSNDYKILGCPALYNSFLIPKWKPIYWGSPKYLLMMRVVVESALHKEIITEPTIKWMRGYKSFLYGAFIRPLSCIDKIHLLILWLLLSMMQKMKRRYPSWPLHWKLLDKML